MMPMLLRSSFLLLTASLVLPACASRSPEAFAEKSAKLGCKYDRDCNPERYEMGQFDSIDECVDFLLDTDFGGEGTLRDAYANDCGEFDSGKARTCLKAARQARSSCDMEAMQDPACNEVCSNFGGNSEESMDQMLREPATVAWLARMIDEAELGEDHESEPEVADELVSEDDSEAIVDTFGEVSEE